MHANPSNKWTNAKYNAHAHTANANNDCRGLRCPLPSPTSNKPFIYQEWCWHIFPQ